MAEAKERVLARIRELGLDENLAELEEQGYTTIPNVLSEEQIERARNAIVARAESASGAKATWGAKRERGFPA